MKYNIQLHFIPLRSTTRAKQINHCKRHQLNVTKSTTPRVTRQLVFLNSRIIKYGYKQVRSSQYFSRNKLNKMIYNDFHRIIPVMRFLKI